MAELNERVSILEVKYDNMEDTLKRLDVSQKEHQEITLGIKEKLDKQNGIIPHMAESLRSMHELQNQIMNKMNSNAVGDAKTNIKLGILWAVSAAIGMGFVGYVIKGFLG